MRPTDVLESPSGVGRSTAQQQFVLLRADSQTFGVPIGLLREIIPPRPYTPLPGSANSVCGLINLRGRIVTVIGLATVLGLDHGTLRSDHRIAILDFRGGLAGLAVDDVIGIAEADPERIGRPAEALRDADPQAAHVRGIGGMPGQEYVVVDPEELFRSVLM